MALKALARLRLSLCKPRYFKEVHWKLGLYLAATGLGAMWAGDWL